MSKKLNISAEIRKIVDEGISDRKKIVELMRKRHRKDVTKAYVSTVMTNYKRSGPGAVKRGRPSKGEEVRSPINSSHLLLAKDYVSKIGGMRRAVATLSILSKLSVN